MRNKFLHKHKIQNRRGYTLQNKIIFNWNTPTVYPMRESRKHLPIPRNPFPTQKVFYSPKWWS